MQIGAGRCSGSLRLASLRPLSRPRRSEISDRLESLKGKWKGYHSIRINDQWRVVSRWRAGNASEVGVIDYH